MLGIEKYYEGYDEDSRLIKDNSHKVEKLDYVGTDGIVHMMRDNINWRK